MKKSTVAIIFCLIIIILLSIYLFKADEVKDNNMATQRYYVAAEGKVEVMDNYRAEVGSELDGRIAEFPVEEGDEVKKGDIIARLDNRDIIARLSEAEAELSVSRSKLREVASGAREEEIKKAKAALESAIADKEFASESLHRYKLLLKEGFTTQEIVDEKEKSLKVAIARVKEAQEELQLLEKGPKAETIQYLQDNVKRASASVEYYRQILNKTLITAPVSGKIIRKYLQKGEVISREMNTPLVAIADLQKLWINAEVDETDIGRFKVGDKAKISSDAYPNKIFHGKVYKISDYVGSRAFKPNNTSRNIDMKVIQVKILLEDIAYFKPGMTVDIKILPEKDR